MGHWIPKLVEEKQYPTGRNKNVVNTQNKWSAGAKWIALGVLGKMGSVDYWKNTLN